ncbi:MBL fold metallo-hydrolase [Curvibacter sp. APW13]|uniref:MBL fold metallo-hydrolase n=1 Tax=Curvibacter sp. APW13 TaxID=3077236 RepID=UPI0028DE8C9D|nr:MBL fold metallo-hydrolase [Curvibacter sp. APW13]MDT8989733.1 MBL fold metallo-hydrolase [Curvibacter sp. APW13]
MSAVALPAGVSVFERGWLSSNNVLLVGPQNTALVDSGYCSHAAQTLALVDSVLQGRPLDVLVNTHLHSDHCGGNAALQAHYPALQTHIPPGHAPFVAQWDPHTLSYTPTGQECPQYRYDAALVPGQTLLLGAQHWQVHAAPGHDSHSVILFEPASRTLISADALWERGFGVVFPELDGVCAFDEVGATLDLIESLQPSVVIPGHGGVFTDVAQALQVARQRLDGFVRSPLKHYQYATKVLIKFKLLDLQRVPLAQLRGWVGATPYVQGMLQCCFPGQPVEQAVDQLLSDLVRSGAAERDGEWVLNR